VLTKHLKPSPAWTAWLYAAARDHPDWKLEFTVRGPEVTPCGPAAGSTKDLMHAYAHTHPQEMERFAELPDDWDELTAAHLLLIERGEFK